MGVEGDDMTLSAQQLEQRDKFNRWFWIYERDLLWCARKWAPWRLLAHALRFTDAAIDSPWTHADEGRLIRYMENPEYHGG